MVKANELKTITPRPGTPTADVRRPDGWRGKEGMIDGVKVWLKGKSPTGGNDSQSPYHERAAYLLDRMLHFNIVPPTVLQLLEGEVISAQKFVKGKRPRISIPPILALWDYIIDNSDRHDGNWYLAHRPEPSMW
uniref:PI3K/PI4K catalytic domain-containing protein n=1 Tax=viral metagenome TaxID=1070528 RepID=A0A6M3JQK2_9ZZZZ